MILIVVLWISLLQLWVKKDNAIFLDTSTLAFEYAPVKLEGKELLIINTNKKHKIATSG